MKNIIVAVILTLAYSISNGQSFSWTTTDTMIVKLELDTYVELKMEQTNETNDTLKLGIEIIHKNIPSSWDGMVCVEGFCLGVIPEVGAKHSMRPVHGEEKGFVRLTVSPMKSEEFGELRIRVYNLENPTDSDTATWLLNDKSLGVKGAPLAKEVGIYPNPTSSEITVKSDGVMNKIRIMSLTGQVVLEEEVISGLEAKIDVSSLPKGVYSVNTIQNEVVVGYGKLVVK